MSGKKFVVALTPFFFFETPQHEHRGILTLGAR